MRIDQPDIRRHRTRLARACVLGSAAIALALTATGCGPDENSSATPSPSAPVVVTSTVTESETAPGTTGPTEVDSAAPVNPGTPVNTVTASATPKAPSGADAFTGAWVGHTRDMNLNADGTGDMSVSIGAADGEKWALTWSADSSGATMTLGEQISKHGEGLGDNSMHAGAVYHGVLVKDSQAVTYMQMAGFTAAGHSLPWCNQDKYGYSRECGA